MHWKVFLWQQSKEMFYVYSYIYIYIWYWIYVWVLMLYHQEEGVKCPWNFDLYMKLHGVTSQNAAFLKFVCFIISVYYYFIAFGTYSIFVKFWYDNLKIYTLLLLYKIKVNIFYYSSLQEWSGILVVLYSGCSVSHQHRTWHDHLWFQSDFQCLQILMNKYKIINK